jgi:ABC-type multidrug transport system ATPase subunit
MKKLTVKLNKNYRIFNAGYQQELEGNLIVLSGVNGSGKSLFTDIIASESFVYKKFFFRADDFGLPREKTQIDSTLLIDGEIVPSKFISKRSFKDNIFVTDTERVTSTYIDSSEQAWKSYREGTLLEEDNNSGSKKRIREILKKHRHTVDSRTLTLNDFKRLLPDDFVWEQDIYDSFSNDIFISFQEFAARRQDEKAKCGEVGKLFNAVEYNKSSPWSLFNDLFQKLKLSYRFKKDYDYRTPNLTEIPSLHQLNSATVDYNTQIKLSDLSDGEKSIISLVLAVITEKKRNLKKVMIFDEFDNTLNPSLIEAFYTIIDEYFIKKDTLVIIVTHMPTTIALAPEDAQFYEMFRKDNTVPKIISVNRDAYQEMRVANKRYYDEIADSSERIKKLELKNENLAKQLESNKPILFVEDAYTQIYKLAWLKLNDKFTNEANIENDFSTNSGFNIFGKGNRSNLQGFLNNPFMEEWKDKCIIGLFDFDDAYKEDYKSKLKTDSRGLWEEKSTDISKGLYKKRKGENIYAVVLPVPDFRKSIANIDLVQSYLEAELLFEDAIIKRIFNGQDYSIKKLAGGIEIPKINNKGDFWRKCTTLEKSDFSAFISLFSLVDSLIGSSANV